MFRSCNNGVTSFAGTIKIFGQVPPPNSLSASPFVVKPVTFASLGITRDATLLSKLTPVAAIAPNMGLGVM